MKRTLGIISLCLITLPILWIYFAIRSQEMSYLNWFLPAAGFLWLVLFGGWYLIFGGRTARARFARVGIAGALLLTLALLAAALLRYEGSASGSSFPKFRWVWQAEGEGSSAGVDRLVQGSLAGAAAEVRAAAGESLDFLGEGRDGMDPDLPFQPDWKTHPPELLWRRPIGKAWSGFAVKEGRAITQEQAGDSERVVCLDLYSGEELWSHEDPGIRLLDVKEENSGVRMGGDGPRSTPVVSGDRVFAFGSTGILNCLDLETGKEIWEVDTMSRHGGEIQKWGMANAPLLLEEEDLVIVPGSDRPGATLIALFQEDGSEAWTYSGEGASYSSPRILTLSGVRQIVSVNAQSVTGHEPATGKLLWKEEWSGGFPKVAQPIQTAENRLLVTASYGVGSLLLEVGFAEGKWSVERLWKTNRMKTKFSSPVILNGVAYGIDEGRLAAIDLETGEKVWKNEKVGFGQQLLFGDHLLIQTEEGPLLTGPVSAEGFTETGRIDALSTMTWNVPTVAGRLLLARNDREAVCYLLPAP